MSNLEGNPFDIKPNQEDDSEVGFGVRESSQNVLKT